MDFVALRERLNELDSRTWKEIRQAALAGNAEAQYLLGYRYFCTDVGRRSCGKWLQAAAVQNHPEATYRLYLYQPTSRKIGKKQRDLLLRAAELGSLQAQRDLAVCYIWGEDGYEENWSRARFWYRQAALGGHPESMVACGSMMMRGDGGETRRAEGLSFLEVAARGPDRDWAEAAMEQLILIYEGCFGLVADPEIAAEWKGRLERWQQEEALGFRNA